MDRFDCQLLMGTFVNVYISSFIRCSSVPRLNTLHTLGFLRVPNANRIIQHVMWLPPEEQLHIYNRLHEQLVANGILGG